MTQVQFEPVKPVRAYERVVEQVEMAVLNGTLNPGDHLASERVLMAQFAVSRSTVREALRVLESHGLVRSRPGDPSGPMVLPMSAAPLHKSMTRLASTKALTLAELLQFRILLEGTSAFLAAELRTEDHLATMERALDELRKSADRDFTEFSRADLEFHEAMAAASHNTLVQVCAQVVRGVTLDLIVGKLAQAEAPDELMRNWILLHSNVFEAIRDKDGHRAATLMRRDIFDYYSPYVLTHEQSLLRSLVEESGSATDMAEAPSPPAAG